MDQATKKNKCERQPPGVQSCFLLQTPSHTHFLCCVLCRVPCVLCPPPPPNTNPCPQLVSEGFYEFWNWFDSDSWYPLGRVVGGTVYPGIMITAATVYKVRPPLTLPTCAPARACVWPHIGSS